MDREVVVRIYLRVNRFTLIETFFSPPACSPFAIAKAQLQILLWSSNSQVLEAVVDFFQ